MNKRKDPRTEFYIVRITKLEKQKIKEEALELGYKDPSKYGRYKLGLKD